MSLPLRRAIWVLGACQCVYWGVLYYGFSVLLVPMQIEFGRSRTVIAGAFSGALLLMALVAPRIGTLIDRDRGVAVMRGGAVLAVSGLLLAAQARTLIGMYAAWLLIGLAMAAVLYEPAFGLVIRSVNDARERLRALAAVTVLGGLASTIFLPLLALVLEALDWRATLLVAAALLLLAAWAMERYALPVLHAASRSATVPLAVPAPTAQPLRHDGTLAALALVFVSGTLASMALTTLLIPVLVDRGRPASAAATVLAMLGIMQLPGRIWLLRGGRADSIRGLLFGLLILQAAGLAIVAVTRSLPLAAAGVAIFGVGAGLHTLARPWAIQSIYGIQAAGRVNGQLAALQGFARAAGPILAVFAYDRSGAVAVFAGLAVAMIAMLPAALFATRLPGAAASRPASAPAD